MMRKKSKMILIMIDVFGKRSELKFVDNLMQRLPYLFTNIASFTSDGISKFERKSDMKQF